MEQSYFFGWFIVVFILYYIASIQSDNQKKIMYYLLSALMFVALAFLSFGTYNLVYDASTAQWMTYNEANYSLQSMFPFGLSFIMAIISGLELIICIGQEWNRNYKGLMSPR